MIHRLAARRFWAMAVGIFASICLGLTGCGKSEPPKVAEVKKTVEVEEIPPAKDESANGVRIEAPTSKSEPAFEIKLAAGLPSPAGPGMPIPGMVGRSGTSGERYLRAAGGKTVEKRSKQLQELSDRFARFANEKPELEKRLQAEQAAKPLIGGGGMPVDDLKADYDGPDASAESYQRLEENAFKSVKVDPLATLSAAVDTAAYSNVRARINEGQLPPADMVRIADFLNYFSYDQAPPTDGKPVAFKLEMAACPWNSKHQLLKVGLRSKVIEKDKLPARNLVFLIDTSGSMNSPNRLPLVIESMKLLVEQLGDRDRVSIVTYAGSAGLRLPPTPGNQKEKINNEIINLQSGGSTNGEGGIKLAYEQAEKTFIKDGINRVILATDGDFNVGVSDNAQLIRMIEDKRKTGVYLTILGFGMGNLHDDRLEQLAHHGNGHYAYIDSMDEAKKMFVEQGAALVTVAKDVKLQIEFNPAKVAGYRLIGYENRILKAEDFRNDAKDAGDMGCGHHCTMLFEVVPVGEKVPSTDVEALKYQTTPQLTEAGKSAEMLTTRMRYKDPETDKASEVSATFSTTDIAKEPSTDFRFAAAVAAYGMLLRNSEYSGTADLEKVLTWAKGSVGTDKGGHRAEFTRLVDKTKDIIDKKNQQPAVEKK